MRWLDILDEFDQGYSIPVDNIIDFGHLRPDEMVNNRRCGPKAYIRIIANGQVERIVCCSTYVEIRDGIRGVIA